MQTRGKVVVYLHPSFVSILSWINSKSGEREALGPYAIESVTTGPLEAPGGGWGGCQAELTPALRMARALCAGGSSLPLFTCTI